MSSLLCGSHHSNFNFIYTLTFKYLRLGILSFYCQHSNTISFFFFSYFFVVVLLTLRRNDCATIGAVWIFVFLAHFLRFRLFFYCPLVLFLWAIMLRLYCLSSNYYYCFFSFGQKKNIIDCVYELSEIVVSELNGLSSIVLLYQLFLNL